MGDDLASDDEYLFDAGLIDKSDGRGTAILDEDDLSDSGDIIIGGQINTNTPSSHKRKASSTDADAVEEAQNNTISSPSSKKRKKKKGVLTNSKSVLIHAGRGIAKDSVDSQAMFLGTLYSHSAKLSGSSSSSTNNDDNKEDNNTEKEEDTPIASTSTFSFLPHLYKTPTSIINDKKTHEYNHTNLGAYLKSGPLPSNKRLKNWKHSHSPMVLIITLSARRSVELMKQLSGGSNSLKLPVCKLFAKHIKLEDQVDLLCNGIGGGNGGGNGGNSGSGSGGGADKGTKKKKKKYYSIAVGTPGRLLKLLQHTNNDDDDNNNNDDDDNNKGHSSNGKSNGNVGALRLNHTELIIIDCHEDSKGWNVCTLKDTSRDLMEFMMGGIVPQLEKRAGKIKLAMF